MKENTITKVGALALGLLFIAGQVIAFRYQLGYEAGCLISMSPILVMGGAIGLSKG